MAARRGTDEPRLLAAGPGRLTPGARRHARARRPRARPTALRALRRRRDRDRGRPQDRDHQGGRAAVALRGGRLALRQQADQARTASLTCIPGAAATPARGSWKITRPGRSLLRLLDVNLEPAPLALPLRSFERQADHAAARLRESPWRRSASRGRRPSAGPSEASGRARRSASRRAWRSVLDRRRQRLPVQPGGRSRHGLADHVRNVDLVRPAVRGLAAAPARRRRARCAGCGSSRCPAAACRRGRRPRRGDPYGTYVDGNDSGSSWRYGSAFSMKVCQISAGNVPPATGSPWYSVIIGRSSRGYPTQTATTSCGT